MKLSVLFALCFVANVMAYPHGTSYYLDLTDSEPVAVAVQDYQVTLAVVGYDCSLQIGLDGVLTIPEGCAVDVAFDEGAFEFGLCTSFGGPLLEAVCVGFGAAAREVWLDECTNCCSGAGSQTTRGPGFQHCTIAGPSEVTLIYVAIPNYDEENVARDGSSEKIKADWEKRKAR